MQLQTFNLMGRVFFAAALVICGMALSLSEAAARGGRPARAKMTRSQRLARKTAITLVKKGVVKLREGDYVAALELFSKAFKVYPSPKIQFNIGQTYKELGRYLDAIEAYEKFGRDAPADTSEALKKLARDNVRELFRKITILRVQVSEPGARISVDGQPRGVSPLGKPLRLMPGAHSMVVKKQGFVTAVVDLRLKAGKQMTRTVTLHKPRPKVIQVIWKSIRKPKKGLPVLWTGVALTGVAGVVAAITGGMALVEEKRKNDLDLPIADRRSAAARGKRYVRTTDGLLLSAGVVALSSLIWYLVVVRPSGGFERVRVGPAGGSVVPHGSPGGGGLTIRF